MILIDTVINDKLITFGCYIDAEITDIQTCITDPKLFIFSLKDGELMKYEILSEKANEAFVVFHKDQRRLFNIGNDIYIRKLPYYSSVIQTENSCFDYGLDENAILGITGHKCFIPKRILVVQMG